MLILGRAHIAGNTLLQNAYSKVEGGGSATVVFYASQSLLMHEQNIYQNAALAPLLPKRLHCNASGQSSGSSFSGYSQRNYLPPFVVLEEVETLQEVLARSKPTLVRALKVRNLSPVATHVCYTFCTAK